MPSRHSLLLEGLRISVPYQTNSSTHLNEGVWLADAPAKDVGEWVSSGVGKRDDPEGDTAEMAKLCW